MPARAAFSIMSHDLDTNIDYFDRHLDVVRRKFSLVCIFLIVLATIPVAIVRAVDGWDLTAYIQFSSTLILVYLFVVVYLKGYKKYVGATIYVVDMVLMSVVILDPLGDQLIALFFITPLLVAYLFFSSKTALLISIFSYCVLVSLYCMQYIDMESEKYIFEMVLLIFSGVSCVAGLHVVIGLRHDIEEKLIGIAHTDALTHLPNRMYFNERLLQEVSRADREGTPLCLSLLDLDHFKVINDTYGHVCGDKILYQIGELINDSIREQDIACRVGGEEIAIIMPNIKGDEAFAVLERLRKAVAENPIVSNQQEIHVTISIGFAEYQNNQELGQLYMQADAAMYKAKEKGRNLVIQF